MEATEKESARKAEVVKRYQFLREQCESKALERKELEEHLESVRIEPRRLRKGIETVNKVLISMEADVKQLTARKE
jgi:hypothetical protein